MHSLEFFTFIFFAGTLVWLLGIYSQIVKAYISPPLIMVLFGVIFQWIFNVSSDALLDYVETLTWISVAFGVTSIALRFSKTEILSILKPGSIIISVAMFGMWIISSLILWWTLGVPLLLGIVIGAIVTPTDPVVASSIVSGSFAKKHIPKRIRYMLSFESGANDGLAYAFLFLPLLLLQKGSGAWGEWIHKTVLWEILVASVIGACVGWIAGRICIHAISRGVLKEKAVLLASMSLTIMIIGFMKMIGTDSIWTSYIAALVFTFILPKDQREHADTYQESSVYLTMAPALLAFGITLPLSDWTIYGWGLVWAALLILLFRRLSVIALLYMLLQKKELPSDEDRRLKYPFHAPRDLLFYGWFGPLGLSAIYYATTAHRHLHDTRVWTIASFCICASIVVHGLTAAPFTRWYYAHKRSHE